MLAGSFETVSGEPSSRKTKFLNRTEFEFRTIHGYGLISGKD
jgi:hypothetical protein